ncbi:MAG: DUF1565 domain-containing protein [Chitinophagaceae bacterium]
MSTKIAGNVTYQPFLINGTDDATGTPGFQPVAGACSGAFTEYYVNDGSTTDDQYTGAIGDDTNPGTAALPFATITKALNVAQAGNTIWVDAGIYASNVTVNKEVTIKGAGYTTKLTSVTTNGNIITVAANNVTIRDLHLEGTLIENSSATRGIYFNSAVSGIAVTNVKSSLHQYAMYADNNADVNGLTVTNSEFLASGNGFQVETSAKVANLTITGGSISNNLYGFSSTANGAATNNQTGLTGVSVTRHNLHRQYFKGLIF